MDEEESHLFIELLSYLQDTLEIDRDEQQSLEIYAKDLRAGSGSDSSEYQVEYLFFAPLLLLLLFFPFCVLINCHLGGTFETGHPAKNLQADEANSVSSSCNT